MLPSIALVTTMWDRIEPEIGASRELELKSRFWQPLLSHGSIISRYENSQKSALSVVDMFMRKKKGTVDVQHELVDEHKTLNDTAAGQELQKKLDARKLKLERHLEPFRARV